MTLSWLYCLYHLSSGVIVVANIHDLYIIYGRSALYQLAQSSVSAMNKMGVVANSCNSTTWEVRNLRSASATNQIQSQPGLHKTQIRKVLLHPHSSCKKDKQNKAKERRHSSALAMHKASMHKVPPPHSLSVNTVLQCLHKEEQGWGARV